MSSSSIFGKASESQKEKKSKIKRKLSSNSKREEQKKEGCSNYDGVEYNTEMSKFL